MSESPQDEVQGQSLKGYTGDARLEGPTLEDFDVRRAAILFCSAKNRRK